jgi:hypothetical protein
MARIFAVGSLTLGILALSSTAYAQRPTPQDDEARLRMQQELREGLQEREARLAQFRSRFGIPQQWIGPDETQMILVDVRHGQPIFQQDLAYWAAQAVKVDSLWPGGSSGFGLTGSGHPVGIWEFNGFAQATHEAFADGAGGDRIDTLGTHRSTSTTTAHATAVTGIATAGDTFINRIGMAYQADIIVADDTLDLLEMDKAADSLSLQVSNHSYGEVNGWGGKVYFQSGAMYSDTLNAWHGNPDVSVDEDYKFGFYDSVAVAWDQLAVLNPVLLPVLAAGNDRATDAMPDGTPHWVFTGCSHMPASDCWYGWFKSTANRLGDNHDNGGYDTVIGGRQVSKNPLSIGAIVNIFNPVCPDPGGPPPLSMTSYSAWGPTDDGRIKPDLMAPGRNVAAPTKSPNGDKGVCSGGTSSAAPVVAGSIGLLAEHSANLGDMVTRGATFKALLIHTAEDMGIPGPDYAYGWGLINVLEAARAMQEDFDAGGDFTVFEETLADGSSNEYPVVSDGQSPLSVTIAWNDPPGQPPSHGESPNPSWLDDSTPMLVNDLDLEVVGANGDVFYPWTLDVDNPTVDAVRTTRNSLDNVEQVLIDAPAPGRYSVRVYHSGTLTTSDQPYSLVMSGISADSVVANVTAFLEGPFSGSSMSAGAGHLASLPVSQAFSDAIFDGTPAAYAGTESVGTFPTGTIDWVRVSLRTEAPDFEEIAARAAILLEDGQIRDVDGRPLIFAGVSGGMYHVVVHARNHIGVMSASAIDFTSGSGTWDFSSSAGSAYSDGGPAMVELATNVYGLPAGDGVPDGKIQALDAAFYLAETVSAGVGFNQADYNLDGSVDSSDLTLFVDNTTSGYETRIP